MQPVDLCSVGLEKLKIALSWHLLTRISDSSRFWLQVMLAQVYLRVHSGKCSLFELTSVLMKRGFGPQSFIQEITCVLQRMLTHWFSSLPCFRRHSSNLRASCTLLNGTELTGGENNSSTFLQLLAIHVTPLSLITSANFTPVKDLIKSGLAVLCLLG